MGTHDENNKAEPQNEFLSGFKIKDRMNSQKEETQKPFFNQQMDKQAAIKLDGNDSVQKKAGIGLFQKLHSKFSKGKSNPADAKQKIMMALIPLLFVIMIFMFRQVLCKPQQEALGAQTNNESTLSSKKSADSNIEWRIPDPLPVKIANVAQSGRDASIGTETGNTANNFGVMCIQSIVYSNDRPSVVIGNEIVYLNQEIRGLVVVEINKDYVVFEKDGKRWTRKVSEEIQEENTDENIK